MSDTRAVLRDAVDGLPAIRGTAESALIEMKDTVRSAVNSAACIAAAAGGELHSIKQAWGIGSSSAGGAVCDLCAAPFVHGPHLAPRIRALQTALDGCDRDRAALGSAHEQLRQLDREMVVLSSTLGAIVPQLHAAGSTLSAAQKSVTEQLACSSEHQHDA
jgi:hypothetical protein